MADTPESRKAKLDRILRSSMKEFCDHDFFREVIAGLLQEALVDFFQDYQNSRYNQQEVIDLASKILSCVPDRVAVRLVLRELPKKMQ